MFDARCVAYAYSLAVLSEAQFTDAENNPILAFPEGYLPRRNSLMVPRVLSNSLVCAAMSLLSIGALAEPQELTIPSFDSHSPACQVRLPETPVPCGVEGCVLPAPKHSTLGSIQLNMSCLPKFAPTGFENPADYVKVQSVDGKNATGHLSLVDDFQPPAAERTRELSFCLYGNENNFCGSTTALRLKDGPKGDATAAIKSFINGIELEGASIK